MPNAAAPVRVPPSRRCRGRCRSRRVRPSPAATIAATGLVRRNHAPGRRAAAASPPMGEDSAGRHRNAMPGGLACIQLRDSCPLRPKDPPRSAATISMIRSPAACERRGGGAGVPQARPPATSSMPTTTESAAGVAVRGSWSNPVSPSGTLPGIAYFRVSLPAGRVGVTSTATRLVYLLTRWCVSATSSTALRMSAARARPGVRRPSARRFSRAPTAPRRRPPSRRPASAARPATAGRRAIRR